MKNLSSYGKSSSRGTVFFLLPLAATLLFVGPAAGQQCLSVLVIDPSGAPVSNASVTIGNREQPADDSGIAAFCGLGGGPHSVVVLAPGFASKEETARQSEGQITITMQLAVVSEEVNVVAVGSRAGARDPLTSPVPVELVLGERLRGSGHTETGRALQMLAPSFNFTRSSITDGTDSVRPATLRGLAPDQTLVLVNGLPMISRKLYTAIDLLAMERSSFPR